MCSHPPGSTAPFTTSITSHSRTSPYPARAPWARRRSSWDASSSWCSIYGRCDITASSVSAYTNETDRLRAPSTVFTDDDLPKHASSPPHLPRSSHGIVTPLVVASTGLQPDPALGPLSGSRGGQMAGMPTTASLHVVTVLHWCRVGLARLSHGLVRGALLAKEAPQAVVTSRSANCFPRYTTEEEPDKKAGGGCRGARGTAWCKWAWENGVAVSRTPPSSAPRLARRRRPCGPCRSGTCLAGR